MSRVITYNKNVRKNTMIHFEREILKTELIEAMLQQIHIMNLGMTDEDG